MVKGQKEDVGKRQDFGGERQILLQIENHYTLCFYQQRK